VCRPCFVRGDIIILAASLVLEIVSRKSLPHTAMADAKDCGALFAQQLVLFLHSDRHVALEVRWGRKIAHLQSSSARGDEADRAEYGGECVEISYGDRGTVVGSRTAFEFLKQLTWLYDPTVHVLGAPLSAFFDFEHTRMRPHVKALNVARFAEIIQEHEIREMRGVEVPNRCLASLGTT